ncbi:hypothetical protein KBZ21_06445 [Streptomyces sp. A73]|uniref:hypothetical protein n=1 Tax=Streptomyces TaxID=1883 RepID=UPI001B371B77|nr:hypothetical protein [Streptomyces sp. RK75]MBQ0866550.1 hypothetical protein [Streptomyces sp. RK75]MBQ1157802.1 hypothetical protein [Streptomyces sp. A73]
MKNRILLLCGGLALVIISAAAWWIQPEGKKKLAVPERVCRSTFSGTQVEPLLHGGKGKVQSNIERGFPGSRRTSSGPVCELSAEGKSVSFRIEYPSFHPELRKLEQERKHVATMGPAYGSYNESNGTISLDIVCPTRGNPESSLFVNVGASMVREGEKESLAKLADLTGYAARTLAQDVYKCKGADELPEGPVSIRRGEGSR